MTFTWEAMVTSSFKTIWRSSGCHCAGLRPTIGGTIRQIIVGVDSDSLSDRFPFRTLIIRFLFDGRKTCSCVFIVKLVHASK